MFKDYLPSLKELVLKPVPAQLIKQREGGGGKMLSYLSGSTVIDMLNIAFDYNWSWEVEREWVQESIPMKNKKTGEEYPQPPVAHVRGRLTVYRTGSNGDMQAFVKSAHGSKTIIGNASEQESIFKSAGTDALKKAASLFGIGQELYRNEDEQTFFQNEVGDPVWTEETMAECKEDFDFVSQVVKEQEWDTATIDQFVHEMTGGKASGWNAMTPETLKLFASELRSALEAEAAKAKDS